MTTTITAPSRNIPLVAARVVAGLLGTAQLAGVVFFLFLAPEEAAWVGLWVDIPIVALLLASVLLKIAVGFLPRLSARRRIHLGLFAATIGIAVTLVKIPVYDEPEGVIILAFDAVLVVLLSLARRTARR